MNLQRNLIVISGICLVIALIFSWLNTYNLITTSLFFIVLVSAGYPVLRAAFIGIWQQRILNIDFLVLIAVLGALYIGQFGEAAAVMFFFSLAEAFEEFGVERSRRALTLLMQKSPKKALLKGGTTIPIEEVRINDIIIVRPGDIIPLDGSITDGYSTVDEAAITGESIPKDKRLGNAVFSGTTNINGYLEIRVTKESKDSTFSKITALIEDAQKSRIPMQRFIDAFAQFYTPTIIFLAFFVAIIPPLLGKGTVQEWLYLSLTLLLIACPCALVVSAPVSIAAGIGRASQAGVLIKGGKYLELLGKINIVAFDKTKTLTEGKLSIADVIPFEGFSKEEVLADAAGLEVFSSHPIAESIVEFTKKQGIFFHQMGNYEYVAGKGGKASCYVCKVPEHCIGNIKMIDTDRPEVAYIIKEVERLEKEGKTVVLISENNKIMGAISLSDTLRPKARQAIDLMHKMHIQTVMLTGDNTNIAHFIALQVNIKTVFAALLPDQKVEKIKELKKKGIVAMIGDGVNDAPALAVADIGIAMGTGGSDVAIETADVALMNDNLLNISFAIQLGAKTLSTIKINVAVAIGVKIILLVLAFMGIARLNQAIATDAGVALLVILHSLNLFRFKKG